MIDPAGAWRALGCVLIVGFVLAAGGFASAQAPPRTPACIAANDQVTAARLGKDRSSRPVPLNLTQAVAVGDRYARQCRGDDTFMLAYALARIDLSGNPKLLPLAKRTPMFNGAVSDLGAIKSNVLAGRSDRYEIFNVLALIYYDVGRYADAVNTARQGAPLAGKMTPTSRQKMFTTLGLAQAQLGQTTAAAISLDTAQKFGSQRAAGLKQSVLGTK